MAGNPVVRLLHVGFGLALAGVAAALFLSFGFVREAAGPAFERATEYRADSALTALVAILIGPAVFKAFFAPATIAVALAELAALRGLVANLALGGVLALYCGWRTLAWEGPPPQGAIAVLLSAGFVAGFVYWAVAGRSAGKWLQRRAPGVTGSR